VPSLIDTMGSEISAVVLQTVLCGLLGSVFAASSVIWEMDDWSIAKQTGIYFLILTVVMMPIAYFTNWMEHSIIGFIIYFGIFVGIFIVVWLVQYLIWKKKVNKLNTKYK
jgi:predicted MFS family arabinose efflux permease